MVKISKVNHMRAAQLNGKGMLNNPDKKEKIEKEKDLVSYVSGRKNAAARLYKVFNEKKRAGRNGQKNDKDKKAIKALTDCFDGLIKEIKAGRDDSEKRDKAIEYLTTASIEYVSAPEVLEKAVDDSLRNSLRGKYVTEEDQKTITGIQEVKKLVKYLCEDENTRKNIGDEYNAFIELLIRDVSYWKTASFDKKNLENNEVELGRLAPVPVSIIGQNVKVECDEDHYLKLSSKKKMLVPFLMNYACADEHKKKELLEFQRYCLALLVYGKDETPTLKGRSNAKTENFGFEEIPSKDRKIEAKAEKNYEEIKQLWEENKQLWEKIKQLREEIRQLQESTDDSSKKENNRKIKLLIKDKDSNNRKIRLLNEENDILIRDRLYENFRNAKKLFADSTDDEKKEAEAWLEHFLDLVLPLAVKNPYKTEKNLECMHLCHMAWSRHVAFLREKYTDLGKAVYHFAVPKEDLFTKATGSIKIGPYRDDAPFGISSFGYEYIKAEESLQKELSLYLQFAVNNFGLAVFPAEQLQEHNWQDPLLIINREDFKGSRADLHKSLLRYFGGASRWGIEEEDHNRQNGNTPDSVNAEGQKLAYAIRECIYPLRNQSFHYTGKVRFDREDAISPVRDLFEKELAELDAFYRKRFNSNNVFMFYGEDNSKELLRALYSNAVDVPAQIPSFKKVFPRQEMTEYIQTHLPLNSRKNFVKSQERAQKFRSCLYFLFLEIYYNKFLADPGFPGLFLKKAEALEGKKPKYYDVKEFKSIIVQKLGRAGQQQNISIEKFGRLCQYFVSEYDRQNHDVINDEDLVYKNYPLLMHQCLKKAFIQYIDDHYAWLKTVPVNDGTKELKEEDWKMPVGHGIDPHDPSSLAWYATARFLVPEYVNRLIGEFSKYNQYVTDIMERYRFVKGEACEKEDELKNKIEDNKKIIRVLKFALETGSECSNNIEDYFGPSEYEKRLNQYIADEYEVTKEEKDSTGIYYDGKNYKVNRNLVFASMFGAEGVLPYCMTKVSKEEIEKYREDRKTIQNVFGKQLTDQENGKEVILKYDDRKQLREYEDLKKRVELTDVLTFSKLINDLMAQMIVWACLRERDKMYFQLGYHYLRLRRAGAKKPEEVKITSTTQETIEEGAILYELAAAYMYDMPMFEKNGDGYALSRDGHNPEAGRNTFETVYPRCYDEGLELFKADENRIRKFRNSIDHFHYFHGSQNGQGRSLLEMYAVAYDEFLSFSTNYRKSVPLVLTQILEDHKVKAAFDIKYPKGEICFVPKGDFHSEKLTFTVEYKKKTGNTTEWEKGKKQFDAHSEVFLKQVKDILAHKP